MSRSEATRPGAGGPVAAGAGILALTYLGFVSLGLPDAAYGVAWPFLRAEFALAESHFGVALVAISLGFLGSSLNAGTLIRRFGAGRLLAGSTLAVGLGLLGFGLAPSFPLFVLSGGLVGLGGGAIDAGLNTYAAGHYSARQMNWLHAAFGLGAAMGPAAMTLTVGSGSWRGGYLLLGAAMLAMAALFFATRRLFAAEVEAAAEAADDAVPDASGLLASLRLPLVRLQVLLFLLYTGVEIGFGQWAFTVLSEVYGFTVAAAGFWTSVFWFSLFVGRVLLGFGADRIGTDRLIALGLAGAALGAALFLLNPLGLAPFALALTGFALAPVFPMLMHKTPRIFPPRLAGRVVGYQVSAAMLGGVLFPALTGLAADAFGRGAVPYALAALALLFALVGALSLRRAPTP